MAKSKLIPAVLLGNLVGAAISMLDKNTRQHTIETSKKIKDTSKGSSRCVLSPEVF